MKLNIYLLSNFLLGYLRIRLCITGKINIIWNFTNCNVYVVSVFNNWTIGCSRHLRPTDKLRPTLPKISEEESHSEVVSLRLRSASECSLESLSDCEPSCRGAAGSDSESDIEMEVGRSAQFTKSGLWIRIRIHFPSHRSICGSKSRREKFRGKKCKEIGIILF